MRCQFCAEEIQDAAILCRHCGATKHDGSWTPPTVASLIATKQPRPGGVFTMRSAGALFIASAAVEILSITAEVPLFGALRGGVVAIGYHALFIVVFSWMGIGLWRAESWGYRAVLVGTGIYALDKALYLLDDAARSAAMGAQSRAYGQIFEVVDPQSIDRMVTSVTLIFLACWIGFALYVHLRRDYFQDAKTRITT